MIAPEQPWPAADDAETHEANQQRDAHESQCDGSQAERGSRTCCVRLRSVAGKISYAAPTHGKRLARLELVGRAKVSISAVDVRNKVHGRDRRAGSLGGTTMTYNLLCTHSAAIKAAGARTPRTADRILSAAQLSDVEGTDAVDDPDS